MAASSWVTLEFKDMGYIREAAAFDLGAPESRRATQIRQGVVGEHWASLVNTCKIPKYFTPDQCAIASTVRELRSRPA